MSAQDASFLYFERDVAPLHIGSVAIYEGTVPYEKLYASLDARMHTIPRYRQRAIIPPFFAGHPTWEDDPEFSLDRHLHLARLPDPGTDEQLRDLTTQIFAPMLPRDRPLWDITVVHGLQGDRTAMVSRVHHCLVDGVSGIELLLAVLDLSPNPQPPPPPEEPWQPKTPPTPLESWADAMLEQFNSNIRTVTEFQRNLLDPRGQFRAMTDFARAIEVALPSAARRAPDLPWNRPLSGERRTAWMEMNFQEVRGIRSRLGGTVNDVVLTVLGGALGRYLQSRGVRTEGLKARVMIPVNVREENKAGALGNRVSMMLPDVPVGIANPADRLLAVREEMERLKSEEQAGAFEAMRRQGDNLPAIFHALAGMAGLPSGVFNLVCTNVPGPLIPLYAVGHRMLAHIPLVPLADSLGLGVGVTSYDKSLYLSAMSDPRIVPEVDEIAAHAEEEFRILRYVADVPVSDLPRFGPGQAPAAASAADGATAAADTVDAPIEETSAAPAIAQ